MRSEEASKGVRFDSVECGESKAELIKESGELTLEVERQDGMSDGPCDDAEVFGPSTGWNSGVIGRPELSKPSSDPVAVMVLPSGCLFFKRWPVFVALVAVANFGGVDDPEQPVSGCRASRDGSGSEDLAEAIQVRRRETVFEDEDWKARCRTGLGKVPEVAFQTLLDFIEICEVAVHASGSATVGQAERLADAVLDLRRGLLSNCSRSSVAHAR